MGTSFLFLMVFYGWYPFLFVTRNYDTLPQVPNILTRCLFGPYNPSHESEPRTVLVGLRSSPRQKMPLAFLDPLGLMISASP